MCFFIVSNKSPTRFWGLVSQNQNQKKKKDEGRFIYKNEYNNINLSTILLLSY